jgi:ribonuclease T2
VPSPNTTNGLPNGTVVPAYNGSGIGTFLEPFGRYDLLEYMNKYWIAQNSPNQDLWAVSRHENQNLLPDNPPKLTKHTKQHEFSKHATCFSTFDLPCYGPQYVQHEEVVDFFDTVILYNSRLNTFEWLANHGITPSNSTTYTVSDIEAALSAEYGATPFVGCSGPRFNETAAGKGSLDNGRTQVSEMWYYFHVDGRPQDGHSVVLERSGKSSCAKAEGAVHYYERANGSVRATGPMAGY